MLFEIAKVVIIAPADLRPVVKGVSVCVEGYDIHTEAMLLCKFATSLSKLIKFSYAVL